MKTLIWLLVTIPVLTNLAMAEEQANLPFVNGLPGALDQSVMVDGYVYCSTSSGLMVLDVSDPSQSVQVSMLPLLGWGRGIAAQDGYAYLLVWDLGLVVIDIQDPYSPQVVGTIAEPDRPSGIKISDHHAFISDMGLGLAVVNIADPTEPQWITNYPLAGELRDLDVVQGVAYIAGDYSGLHIVDVSNASEPVLITTEDFSGYTRDVAVRDGLAYVACGSFGLRILDVNNPAAPFQVGQVDMDFGNGYAAFTGSVSLMGDYACMSLLHHGLGMVDVSNPTTPLDLVDFEIRGSTKATEIHQERAYVSASHGGLVVVDLTNPVEPQKLNQFWLLGRVTDLEVDQGKIWVTGGYSPPDEKSMRNHDAGLFVVDMWKPFGAEVIGYCTTGLEPSHIALSGQNAFLSTAFGGLRIQDIADPTNPVEVGDMASSTESYAHAAEGDFVYTFLSGRFIVMDVSDPAQPVEAGSCDVDFYGSLSFGNSIVYSTIGHLGLQVFDVSDSSNPTAISWLDLPNGAQESATQGHFLYVANGMNGLSVVDVSNPTQPFLVGSCELPGYAISVACMDSYAYLVSSEFINDVGGLSVVDISDPSAPRHVAGSSLPKDAQAVAMDDFQIYVGSGWGGVLAFSPYNTCEVEMISPRIALKISPNPFNPRTTISYEVVDQEQVTLSVHDVAGRLVCTLIDEMKTVGVHEVTWTGRDDNGHPVSSGVYFARMRIGESVQGGSMVMIR